MATIPHYMDNFTKLLQCGWLKGEWPDCLSFASGWVGTQALEVGWKGFCVEKRNMIICFPGRLSGVFVLSERLLEVLWFSLGADSTLWKILWVHSMQWEGKACLYFSASQISSSFPKASSSQTGFLEHREILLKTLPPCAMYRIIGATANGPVD